MSYELFYWTGIQGRGEPIRLALEQAGAKYVDVARLPSRGGDAAVMRALRGELGGVLPFAPPILRNGRTVVAQTAAILQYLGPRLNLVPKDERARLAIHQHQLTIADLYVETHDTHHPISIDEVYEMQQRAARARAATFVSRRMPKFLRYFEQVLRGNRQGKGWLVSAALSYVDLSLFQLLDGLRYAFPNAFEQLRSKIPALRGLRDRVAALPRIAAYLGSERRLPFNQMDIFRHYPELDLRRPRPRRV